MSTSRERGTGAPSSRGALARSGGRRVGAPSAAWQPWEVSHGALGWRLIAICLGSDGDPVGEAGFAPDQFGRVRMMSCYPAAIDAPITLGQAEAAASVARSKAARLGRFGARTSAARRQLCQAIADILNDPTRAKGATP